MKVFKALRKSSTGEYYTWDNEGGKWMPTSAPDLMGEAVTIEQLKSIGMITEELGADIELTEVVVMEKSECLKIKPDFIENYPLGLLFFGKEIEAVEAILKEANEHYVLEWKVDGERPDMCQINIICPTTSFANAYYHIGAQIGRQILSKRKIKKK